jgi:hypothetical protein
VRALFDVFHQQLADKGLLCREGKTVDAMIVEVPRQRNSRKENESIKNGEVPDAWKGQPRKLAQKDTDARWTKKRNVTYFGYKDSVVGGITDCFVHDYVVSAAQHHDSQIVPEAYYQAAGEDPVAFGDSAYGGPDIAERLRGNGINPLFPTLRSDPMALSGASRTKQIPSSAERAGDIGKREQAVDFGRAERFRQGAGLLAGEVEVGGGVGGDYSVAA